MLKWLKYILTVNGILHDHDDQNKNTIIKMAAQSEIIRRPVHTNSYGSIRKQLINLTKLYKWTIVHDVHVHQIWQVRKSRTFLKDIKTTFLLQMLVQNTSREGKVEQYGMHMCVWEYVSPSTVNTDTPHNQSQQPGPKRKKHLIWYFLSPFIHNLVQLKVIIIN